MLVVALAAGLRLWGGPLTPGWFSDEGAHLSIASNLLLGREQFLAVGGSTLLFSRLPAFEWLLAGALWLAGAGPGGDPTHGLAVLRALTGGLGALTTAAVWAALRGWPAPRHWPPPQPSPAAEPLGRELGPPTPTRPRPHTPTLPLLAALIHALYPPAVLYSRFGFSYNLLAPVVVGVWWAAAGYWRTGARRWLALAAGLAGAGTLIDVWGWVLLPPLMAVALARGWAQPAPRAGRGRGAAADAALAALVAGAPFALYALAQALRAPAAFWFDLRFVLGRLGGPSLGGQARLLLENLVTLAGQEGWLLLGLAGLLALRPRWPGALLGLGPLLLLARTTPLFSLSFYYLIPLLPLAAAGLAAVVRANLSAGTKATHTLAFILHTSAFILLVAALWANGRALRDGFTTAIDPFLLDPHDARAAADFLRARREPDELVLASPALAWLLPGQAADFQMALAYAGQPTPHVPPSLPPERYAFSPHPDRARYVVVDNLWHNWGAVHVPGLAALLREVEAWPAVFRAGEITVYARP